MQQGGGRAGGTELLSDLPVGEELAQVTIREGSNTLTLAKTDGIWGVVERGDYPANYSEVVACLRKIGEI